MFGASSGEQSGVLERAILLAPGVPDGFELMGSGEVPEFFELFGRPLVQFVVEALVDRGVREIDWILCEQPSVFREYFGSGERWGVVFRYHLCPDPERPGKRLRVIGGEATERVGIFSSLVIPGGAGFPGDAGWIGKGRPGDPAEGSVTVPWCLLTTIGQLAEISRWEGDFWSEVATRRERIEGGSGAVDFRRLEYLPKVLEAAFDEGDFLRHVMGKVPGSNGWIQRGVVLHPSVRLVEPFFVGEECRVEKNVTIGPGAIVGAGSLIDEGAEVVNSVLAAQTYLGRLASVERAVVRGSRLVNLRIGGAIDVEDAFILGTLREKKGRNLILGILDWMVAGVLWVLTLPWRVVGKNVPVRVIGGVGPNGTVKEVEVSRGARAEGEARPRSYFRAVVVPGLSSVLAGKIGLIGFPMRRPEDWRALPEEHRKGLSGTRVGLISEGLLRHGLNGDATLLRAADIVTLRDNGVRGWLRRGMAFVGDLIRNGWDNDPDGRKRGDL